MAKFRKYLTALCLVAMIGSDVSWAQGVESGPAPTGPRKQLATIVFAGLAGAVLGLSTLSFYGRPQDKLSNIAVGFAIGIIGGTVYTTYKTATQPYGYSFIETDEDSFLSQSGIEDVRAQSLSMLDKIEIARPEESLLFSKEWSF